MASLFNTKISNTYVGLIKTIDNAVITATLKELTDGSGNATGLSINTGGDFKASGTIEWGSLKDTGENITITKFVDEADGIANNDNDTTIPTSAAIVDYVAARITLEDLDFSGDSGTGSVDLDSQVFAITGTANQIETTASGQGLSFAFPSAGIVLPNGSTATTQSAGDNSTKIATTAYVETAVDTVDTLAEILAIGNTTGATKISVDNTSSGIDLIDDAKIRLGTGNDFEIYHNGSNSYIDETGTGSLYVRASDSVYITKADGSSNMAQFTAGGGSFLYFNNNLKLNTSSDGISVTGGVTATGSSVFTGASFSDNITVADDKSVYIGTGNDLRLVHTSDISYITNSVGNLEIIQNTDDGDIIFKSDDGSGGTTEYFRIDGGLEQNVVSKNMKFDDNVQAVFGAGIDLRIYHDTSANNIINENGALKIEQKADDGQIIFYNDDGSGGVTQYLNIHGTEEQVQFLKDSEHQDNVKAKFGDAGDLEIYHDGSNSHIDDTGTGNLVLRGNGAVSIQKYTGENLGMFNADGGVDLYHDDTKKFETTATGVTITGALTTTGNISSTGISMGDNEKAIFGTGGDLEVYHSGSTSYISDIGTGDLKVLFSNDFIIEGANGETCAKFTEDASVELYENNVKKLETKSDGVDVYGSLDASGTGNIDVSSTSSDNWASMTIQGSDTSSVYLFLKDTSGERARIQSTANNDIKFLTNGGGDLALELDSSTNASFSNNVTIAGDLTVNGTTTTVNTDHFNVEDPLISMAKDNAANTVDIGFYGRYNDGSNRYLGLFSDASDDNRFKLFKGTTTEPTTTVNTGATGYEYANILLASLESRGNIKITSASSPHLEITDSTNTCTFKAYAQDSNAHIGTMTNHSFVIDTNGTAAMTLDTSQNAEFAGDVTITGGDLTIGTDSVAGNINSVGDVMAFDVDSNTGGASPNYQFKISNSEQMRLNGSGLGIGTTGGTAKLEISGGSLASGTVTNIGMASALTTGRTRAYDSGTLGSISTRGDSTALELVAGSSAGYFTGIGLTSRGATAASGTLIGYTYGAERFRVDAGGDFGINVTNPVHKLHVGGDAKISHAGNGNAPILHVIDTADTEVAWFEGNRTSDTGAYIAIQHLPATAAETNRSGIKFQAKDDGDNTTTYAQITQYISDNTDTTEDGDLAFSTVVNGSLTENMRISGGNATFGGKITTIALQPSYDTNYYNVDGTISSYSASNYMYVNGLGGASGQGLRLMSEGAATNIIGLENSNNSIFFNTNSTLALTLDNSQNATFAGAITGTTATFVKDQNADSIIQLYNANAGAAAQATIYVGNSSAAADGLFLGANGTGMTTAGGFVQDGAAIGSGTGASGGLSIMTRAAADMRFYTDGHTNERMRITSDGKVLVGSTSHSISSAQTFEVNCNSGGIAAIVGDSDTIAPLYVTNTGTTTDNLNPHILFQDNAGNRALMGIDYTQTHLFMNGHSGIDFYTNMSTPVKKLEISSTAGITVNGDSSINRGDQNSGELLLGGTSNGGFVDFDSTNLQLNTQRDPNTGTWINTGKSHAHIGLQGADGGSSIIFGTASANNTTATTRMTINPDGFIGIGGAPVASRTVSIYNTSANNELEFIGTDYTNIYSNTESGFDIGTVSTAGASYLRFLTENAMAMKIDHNGMVTIGGGGVANTRLVARGSTNDSSAHALEAANNSGASMFLVRNDGKVAIGTSAANYTFAVYGDLATFGTVLQNVSATGNGLLVDSTDGTNSYVAGGFRTNAGVYKCVIYGNGDIANVNNSYGTYSDIKLKENIKDATPKLEDICKLKVRNFDLKETKENQIGFVAQELEKVFPSLVYETDDTIDGEDGLIEKTGEKTKAIKSSVLVPMLVKAVQELKAEVDELKKNCNCK